MQTSKCKVRPYIGLRIPLNRPPIGKYFRRFTAWYKWHLSCEIPNVTYDLYHTAACKFSIQNVKGFKSFSFLIDVDQSKHLKNLEDLLNKNLIVDFDLFY